MYGSASRRVPTSRHHVVYSALIVTYSCERSEKKTSASAPSPGRPTVYSTSSPATAAPARPRRRGRPRRRRRPARPRSRCRAAAAPRRDRRADRLRDPAPVRVAAVQRRLDQRRVGDRARRARHDSARGRRDDHAADPRGALAVAHDQQRELAQQLVQRLAEAYLVLGLGRDAHAGGARRHQDHRVVGRELPVDRDAVERALHAHAEQQVGGLGRERRVGLRRSTASSRTRARSSPRPWPGRPAARSPTAARPRASPTWGTRPWSGSPRRTRRRRPRRARRGPPGSPGSPCRRPAARRSRRSRPPPRGPRARRRPSPPRPASAPRRPARAAPWPRWRCRSWPPPRAAAPSCARSCGRPARARRARRSA